MPPYIAMVQRHVDSLRACVWREAEGRAVQEPAPGAWFSLTTGRFALRPALAAADGQDEKNGTLQGNKEAPSHV